MKVRIWRIGSLEHRIMPGPEAYRKLNSILQQASGKSENVDFVWDDVLRVEEVEIGGDGTINVIMPDLEHSELLAEAVGVVSQLVHADSEAKVDSSIQAGLGFLARVQSSGLSRSGVFLPSSGL